VPSSEPTVAQEALDVVEDVGRRLETLKKAIVAW